MTGLTVDEIKVTSGTASNLEEANDEDKPGENRFTVQITPRRTGPVTIELPAGVAQDGANNDNIAAPPFTIQAYAPEPTVEIRIVFNQLVFGLTRDDFVVVNGAVADLSGSGAE